MKQKSLKIKDFSQETGLSLKALRLYEEAGILVPSRSSENGYRLYSLEQISFAQEVSSLRQSGFSIKEIKILLPFRSDSESGLLQMLDNQLLKTNDSIKNLQTQKRQIKGILKQLKQDSSINLTSKDSLITRRIVCADVSESIKNLSEEQLLEKTRKISNEDYLRTVALVDDVARLKLFSILSENAVKLIKIDLKNLSKKYSKLWSDF